MLGPVDEARCFVSDLLRRTNDQARLASPRHGEGVCGGESVGQCRSDAGAGGDLAGVDAVAGDEACDHGGFVGKRNFAQEFGCSVWQQGAYAGRERAQSPCVGAEVVGSLGVRCHTDDDVGAGVEGCLHGIHPARRVLGQRGDGDDVGIRRDGRDRRG